MGHVPSTAAEGIPTKGQRFCKRGHDLDDRTNVKVWRGRRTCLTCKRERSRRDRQDPAKRERILAYWRAYNKRKLATDPEWRARRNEAAQAARLRRDYGITRVEYAALFEAQGGVCAICRTATKYRKRDGTPGHLAVDHDHSTGRVRGLLCDQCNRMIGHLDKDPERAAAAVRYLGL